MKRVVSDHLAGDHGATPGPFADRAELEPVATIRLEDLLSTLRRHVRLVVGVAAVSVVAAGVLAYVTGPAYRAVAVLRLSDPRRALTGGVVEDFAGAANERFADPLMSQVELLKSRAVARAVVDSMPMLQVITRKFPPSLLRDVAIANDTLSRSFSLRFYQAGFFVEAPSGDRRAPYGAVITVDSVRFAIQRRPDANTGVLQILTAEAATSRLLAELKVKLRVRTDIVDVAYSAPDPARAQEVVNRVVDVFRAASAEAAQRQSRFRREFLEDQLKVNDSVLADAREALTAFQRRVRPTGSGTPLGREQAEVPGLELQRQQLLADRRTSERLLAGLRDNSASRKALQAALSMPGIGDNPAVEQLSAQFFQYERARDSVASRSASHPDLPRLSLLASSTEAELLRAVQAAVQGSIASLDGRIAAINDVRTRRVGSLQQDAEETRLAERVENARKVADELRIEHQKARIAEAVTVGQVEIVDHATLPVKPAGIGLAEYLALGLLLGFLFGGAGAFLVERLGSAIAQRSQIEQLGMPVLGVVTHLGRGPTKKGAQGSDAVIEAFRGIRLGLVNLYGSPGPIVVTVTSPGSGDGKSFVSSNLALAFAYAHHRTLLVDADLRRGALHRVLNLPRQPGLTDFLVGDAPSERVVQATVYPSLAFLPGGTRRHDAPELVGSARMAELVSSLRSTYDVIVVDTPPLGAGVDALALAALSGNLLMVLRLGRTDRALAEAKLELVRRLPLRLLGAVLNDVRDGSEYRAYAYYLDGYALTDEPRFRPLVAGQKGLKPGAAAGTVTSPARRG